MKLTLQHMTDRGEAVFNIKLCHSYSFNVLPRPDMLRETREFLWLCCKGQYRQ